MIISEAIILCGGPGTRIANVLPGIPKVLAPVADRPFLSHVIEHLALQGITKFILAAGYRHELIEKYIDEESLKGKSSLKQTSLEISLESKPLGTGGAIRLALHNTSSENIAVVNGDTLFKSDLKSLTDFHLRASAMCTLAIKPMNNFDRYGAVEIDAQGNILMFKEKQFFTSGYINAGTYLLRKNAFANMALPEVFSFEKNYLEQNIHSQKIMAMVQDAYFIDIGVPEDLEKARQELSFMTKQNGPGA
jgi:D-glycero-alpha-D-manno-heptose 1-phosphate guanylyltransferase